MPGPLLALAPLLAKVAPIAGKMGGGGAPGGKTAGAAVGLATGALQALQAAKLKKQANAAMPEFVDPNQAAYLADLNQKRKSIETGADFAAANQAADTAQASTNDALVRASGGDTGATMQGLLMAQRNAGTLKNQAIAQGQSQQQFYDSSYGNQLRAMEARKLQLQMYSSLQKRAEWQAKSKASGANLQAGLAQAIGSQPPQTSAPVVSESPVSTIPTNNLGVDNPAMAPATPAQPDNMNLLKSLGTPIQTQ